MEGRNLPSAVTVAGNAYKRENGSNNQNKLSNEAKDQITVMSELENQTNHESANEPMTVDLEPVKPTREKVDTKSEDGEEISTKANAEVKTDIGSIVHNLTDAKIDNKSKNGEDINTKINAEAQADLGSIVHKLPNAKTEVTENSDSNNELKKEGPVETGVENENSLENVERDSRCDVTVEKPKDSEEDEILAKNVAEIEMVNEKVDIVGEPEENRELETGISSNEAPRVQSVTLDEVPLSAQKEVEDAANANEDKLDNDRPKQQVKEIELANSIADGNSKSVETVNKVKGHDSSLPIQYEAATPNSLVRYLPANMGNNSGEADKTVYNQATLHRVGECDDGTTEEQVAFMKELESFYRERAMDFKPPKFYGQPLNCLKLWRAAIRLGGYDRVTLSKLWRQVGESFHPPKTCTTVSWTFRIFYEKSLLEYERHKIQSGDLQLPVAMPPEASGAGNEGNTYQESGSGRARRDAAARAMQGWHVQRLFNGEAGEPITKDKNINNMAKREKIIKSIASVKQKRPNEVEQPVKAARTETSRQLETTVVDIGPPADWVKINKECFEVYALVPGLLRDEVRVQSDPVGRLVITGQPEQADNPWGITPFKKVVSLPARIDPLQTSAIVTLHGRLFVRVPFESNN